MFEGIICGFIAFAVGYGVLMRIMSRRADVLYGEFIHGRRPASTMSRLAAIFSSYVQGVRLPARR